MAYSEDVNINLNVLAGAMGGVTAIMGGMSALTSTFGQFGTEASQAFGTLDGLLVSATALVGAFTVQSAEAFGQYEQGMKIVQTVSNQTGAAMNELSNRANEMSIAYRTSIGDITDGLQTLGRAGLNSVNEQLDVLESGLQTAKLEGRNLNGVLEELIQNTAMLGGDLKSVNFGEQAEYLNTLMVGTSMTAPIDSHDISQTLQYAGGTAAAAGANLDNKDKLEDLMGTVAAFAQKGVKGSMAGTALRAFFTKPASQDTSVTDALGSIGLSPEDLWEDGGESMKKVSDQVGLIQRRMDALNLSTMDQVELWGKIVGPKMGQQMMKLDSSSIKELTRDIESAKSAEDLATQTLQTYTQKLAEMQQQGDLAYREFGEKAAMWLTPVVEIITFILGLLSEPHINLAVFGAVGSLLAHGFQRAWAMISTVFTELKMLLTDTISSIQTINGVAGGSVSGISQTTSATEVLNTRLAQTNTELAQMQAQFMGIKAITNTGTYVAPLGIVGPNGKLPKNMISEAPQNVFKGNGEYINGSYLGMGARGQYYDPSEIGKLTDEYKASVAKHNKNMVQSIKSMKDAHTYVTKSGETFYLNKKGAQEMGTRSVNYSQAINDAYITKYGQEKGWLTTEDKLNKHLLKAFPMVTEDQMNKNIKNFTSKGNEAIHSNLMTMTGPEYKNFMKGLHDASARLNDLGNYKGANGTFDMKKYQSDQLKAFNLNRQLEYIRNARKEGNIHLGQADGRTFHRAFMLSPQQQRMFEVERTLQKQQQLKQYEQARSRQLSMGKGSINERAQAVVNKRLQAYSNHLSSATNGLKNFGNNLKLGWSKWAHGVDAVMPQIEAKTMASLSKIDVSTMGVGQGLTTLQEASGLNAAQFEKLWMESTKLQNAFFELFGITEQELIVKKQEIAEILEENVAREAEIAATSAGTLSKLGSGLKSVVGYMGGPFMAAMMGITVVMQAVQENMQAWQEKMQEAENLLSEAEDKRTQAEDSIKDLYSSENSSISEADLDLIVDSQYAGIQQAYENQGANAKFEDMYTSKVSSIGTPQLTDEQKEQEEKTGQKITPGSDAMQSIEDSAKEVSLEKEENISELKQNTAALNAATYAYAQAENLKNQQFTDRTWGFNGMGSQYSDGSIPGILNIGDTIADIFNQSSKGFLDTNSPLLTKSQSDSNYAGSTELAGVLAAQMYKKNNDFAGWVLNRDDEGNLRETLQSVLGSDYDQIIGLLKDIDHRQSSTHGMDALRSYNNMFSGMNESTMGRAQLMFKDNKGDLQKLGKQMFRYEEQYDFDPTRSAAKDFDNLKKGIKAPKSKLTAKQLNPLSKKNLSDIVKGVGKAKLTVTDKNLVRTVNKLMKLSDGKLTESNILAMGQLQQLQDMGQIANEQIAPGINQTVQGVLSNLNANNVTGSNTSIAANNAGTAADNAAIIASTLGAQAIENAEHAEFLDLQRRGLIGEMSEDTFRTKLGKGELPLAQREIEKGLEGTSWSLNSGDFDPDHQQSNANRLYKELDDTKSYHDRVNTATWGIVKYAEGAVTAAYSQSQIGEYGGGNDVGRGSGGGGSGGGGSGSGDKNTGSTRNRVDLVLCNKKTIPKLNVNLFKKAPNFTIKNKNFNVRDIKINTEDKPDSITDAIKNGIIKTTKQMDPKIIQSEESVYDPVTATDGSATPNGNTPVSSK